MKKRHLKQCVKEFIAYSIFGLFIITCFIAMCYRAEQIDNKKELSTPIAIENR